jgi:uroporphyrinogen-III synthase
VRRLRAWGFSVEEMPLLRFSPIDPDPELRTRIFDWILFTSPQGVRAFLESDLNPRGARLGTLGQGTAKAVKEAGLCDNLGIGALDGRELANAFVALAPSGATVLLPGPRKRGPEVEQILTEAGYQVTMAPLYDTLSIDPDELPDRTHPTRRPGFLLQPLDGARFLRQVVRCGPIALPSVRPRLP